MKSLDRCVNYVYVPYFTIFYQTCMVQVGKKGEKNGEPVEKLRA